MTSQSFFSRRFSIGNHSVGEGCPVFVIAEAGVAHFGSLEKALALVDLAVDAEADAVKFQVFDLDAMISQESPEWRTRLADRCLPYDAFRAIQSHCRSRGITFMATAHDLPSLDFLDQLGVPAFKIGSGEVENWPYFYNIARRGKPVIFSTGLYQESHIQTALSIFQQAGNRDVAVLHCVTRYPTPAEEVNLPAMDRLQELSGAITGYSDHTAGYHFPLAAVARGAKIIEKHISLDFNVPNAQDWKVSCGPHDLAEFIRQVRELEAGLQFNQHRSEAEMANRHWARKSLVAATHIPAGTSLTVDLLVCKRPGSGISPSQRDEVIGRQCVCDIPKDTVLQWNLLK